MAADLDAAVAALCTVLGVEVGYRDPLVAEFGLTNAVMPVGDTFLEVVSPTRPDAPACRFLDRRGPGGYMAIFQTADPDAARRRAADAGVREVWHGAFPATVEQPAIEGTHLHPADLGGAIVSVDRADPPASWRWAGPSWRSHVRTDRVAGIVGMEVQARDPEALAARWATVLGVPIEGDEDGPTLPLEGGAIHVKRPTDGRGDGIATLLLAAHDPDAVETAARGLGAAPAHGRFPLCGVHVALVPA